MQNVNQKTLKEGDNFKEFILEQVKEMYLEKGELNAPLAVLMDKNRKINIYVVPIEGPTKKAIQQYKNFVRMMLKKIANDMNAVRFLWIAESWMATRPIDNPQKDLLPSDDPKAVTCLLICDETVQRSRTDIYFPEILDYGHVELKHQEKLTMDHKKGDPLGTFQGIVYDPNSLDINPN